ncbi:cyclophilin-like domain-containing protein [Gaertneriomyces semiglobifer]|nr:cyclophilin-like domain-containing protein [Gaertneriomyces semiglobifer]
MGKGTDKLYITHSEHAAGPGGFKRKTGSEFKRLPFFCCSLTLQPLEHPVCTKEGLIFDLTNIIPWLKKHGTNPVTGEKLEAKELIKLNFHKNSEGKYHCPMTYKVFNENTHIVAVKPSGNVYAYEAIEELNVKPKYWKDLLTDEPFKRKDLITIQDPHNIQSRNINDFYYVKNDMKLENEDAKKREAEIAFKINAMGSTDKVLKKIAGTKASSASSVTSNTGPVKLTPSFVSQTSQPYNAAHYSTNAAAASFTSTAAAPQTKNAAALVDEEEWMFERVKGKGYAQIKTNYGNINLELYCEEAPRTCYNFIELAKRGYYKDVSFHRLIPKFMIQGGDPTGTGRGGESVWKKPFADEFTPKLQHKARGMLSMANKGPATNTSQFFLTLAPCPHLNEKHTIFGKIVGGLETLATMEAVPTNSIDKPLKPIRMADISILMDPFDSFKGELAKRLNAGAEKERRRQEKDEKQKRLNAMRGDVEVGSVGKYLNSGGTPGAGGKRKVEGIDWTEKPLKEESGTINETKKRKAGGFGDFSSW